MENKEIKNTAEQVVKSKTKDAILEFASDLLRDANKRYVGGILITGAGLAIAIAGVFTAISGKVDVDNVFKNYNDKIAQ